MKKNVSLDDWEIMEKKKLLETPIVDVLSGPVKNLKTGRVRDFYSFQFPDWVNVIALTDDEHLVFIKQYRYGTGRIEVEIPGGMIEPGENPIEAGCRELREETGYSGHNSRIIGEVCPNPAIQGNSCYTVLVEGASKASDTQMDEMEDIETVILSLARVKSMVLDGSINHGLVLNGLMFYFNQEMKP